MKARVQVCQKSAKQDKRGQNSSKIKNNHFSLSCKELLQTRKAYNMPCSCFNEEILNLGKIHALCEKNLEDLFQAIFKLRVFPLIPKMSVTHMHGLEVYVKKGLPFAMMRKL